MHLPFFHNYLCMYTVSAIQCTLDDVQRIFFLSQSSPFIAFLYHDPKTILDFTLLYL